MALFRTPIIYLIFVTLIFTFSFFIMPKESFASEENLVPNPSFEEGADLPTHWNVNSENFCNHPVTGYQASIEWNQSLGYTGAKSIGITNVYLPSPNTNTSVRIVSDFIQLTSLNQLYILDGRNQGTIGNKGLRPEIVICFYDDSETVLGSTSTSTTNPPNNQAWYGFTTGGLKISYIPPGTTKIKVGLLANCASQFLPPGALQDCRGSVWFDDIKFRRIGNITAHKFEDMNKNGTQDPMETSLRYWELAFYKDDNCNDLRRTFSTWSDQNGNVTFKDTPYGDYSVKETFYTLNLGPPAQTIDARQQGWTNVTQICQNVTLDENNSVPIVNFGNVQSTVVPYFNQTNPNWGTQEYDSANTYGPFFCGTTMAGCGCATTSAAMVLAYHGATKSPTGEQTNPSTLNTWLKSHQGYAFGAIKWNSVASYSVAANSVHGTQKIKFSGVGTGNNFTTLDTDLANNNPVILEEPGHFIVATSKQTPTYTINDPFYDNRKTLNDYSNSFLSTKRYEKTNTDLSAIYIQTPAPTELLIEDSQGWKTGKDQNGQTYNQIPNSYYFNEPAVADQDSANSAQTQSAPSINTLIILTPPQGEYHVEVSNPGNLANVEFSGYDQLGNITTENFSNINTQNNASEYELQYFPQISSQLDIVQKVDINILPGGDNNLLKQKGTTPIVLLSNFNFDPTTVNGATIRIGNNQPTKIISPADEDFNSDSLADVLLHFKNMQVDSNTINICLTGETLTGKKFKGCNSLTNSP